jgi:hypothetical protein
MATSWAWRKRPGPGGEGPVEGNREHLLCHRITIIKFMYLKWVHEPMVLTALIIMKEHQLQFE